MRYAHEIHISSAGQDSDGYPICQAWMNNRVWVSKLPGATLQVALAWRDAFVLVLTDDYDYDGGLQIHMLDQAGHLLDTAFIGTIYGTGEFKDPRITTANQFRFGFYIDTDWEVTLYERPRLRWPWPAETLGVHRKLGWWRHFSVRRHLRR